MTWARCVATMALCCAMLLVQMPVARAAPSEASQQRERPDGHGMVVTGVSLIVVSVLGYVGLAVGLGLGNAAEADLRALQGPEDLQRRRDLLQRGRIANGVAIGSGAAAAALMAAGIPLVIVGRRRAAADRPRTQMSVTPTGLQIRF